MRSIGEIKTIFDATPIGDEVVLDIEDIETLNNAWNDTHRGVMDFLTEGRIFGHQFKFGLGIRENAEQKCDKELFDELRELINYLDWEKLDDHEKVKFVEIAESLKKLWGAIY